MLFYFLINVVLRQCCQIGKFFLFQIISLSPFFKNNVNRLFFRFFHLFLNRLNISFQKSNDNPQSGEFFLPILAEVFKAYIDF